FNTLAWGVPVTGAGGGPLAADPFTADPGTGNINTDLSAIRVIGHEGSLITGAALGGGSDWGAWESISTVYHQNRAISVNAATLVSSILQSILTLDHDPEGDIGSDSNPVNVGFTETLNSGGCPSGAPNGTVCDDLFTFDLGSFAPISFLFGGHKYEVRFQLGNFVNSSSNYDVNADPSCPNGTCTIWTGENVTSSLDVQAQIRQLPEPATLALFGIGLLGLGFAKRRQLKG
ncbi:MAG: THxN family PEP-CTERM protein, partial [Burkholderiaceae bacterium]|nr:THxN family PEP-CTERM protein [Burkholderiaceae bacterium]